MLWFTVWTVLALATLAGALWLGRRLWRQGRALLAELERAADLVGSLGERAEALTAERAGEPIGHDVLSDPAEHRARRAALGALRDERRAARALRHEATFTRWRAYTR